MTATENKQICLVTGATGFIGSSLVELLLEKGYVVRIICRKTSKMDNLQVVEDKIEKFYADLTDPSDLKAALADVHYVYHVAGVVSAPDYETYKKVNVDGSRIMAEAAIEYASNTLKCFVLVSSQAASGPSPKDKVKTEADESNCVSDYGQSKREGELAVIETFEKKGKGLSWAMVRPPAVFGERETGMYAVFKALKKGLDPVFGFCPIMQLNVVYVKDLIRGIYTVATHEKADHEIFNIADPKLYKMTDVTKLMKNALGKKFTIKLYFPLWLLMTVAYITAFFAWMFNFKTELTLERAKVFKIRRWTYDVSKAKELLNFECDTQLEIALQNTADWYKKHGWL